MSNYISQTSSFNQSIIDLFDDRNILQDRLPGDRLTLPNSMQDISVSVNDFIVSETINYSLESLYDNWLYLISSSVIPSNNIPNIDYYECIIADTPTTGLKGFDSTSFPGISSTTSGGDLNGIKKITRITNTVNNNNYNLIATTNTNVILLSGTGKYNVDVIVNNQDPNNIIRSDSSITHPSNEINFISISNHLVNKSNELFVLDDSLKSIFKFDISGMLTLDKAILNNDTPGRLMTAMAGSPGEISDRDKFFNPVSMVSVDDALYILDYHPQQGSVIKQFDSQLNWKRNIDLGSALSSGPIDIEYNPQTRRYYILCHVTSYGGPPEPPELVIYDEMFNYIGSTNLMDPYRHDQSIKSELFKSIYFSFENPNIMYLVSEKNIYKKYVSRPVDFIGRFKTEEKNIGTGDIGDMKFQDISIHPVIVQEGNESIQKDEILLYESTYEIVHKFLEDSNYEKSLETEFDDKVLPLTELTIQPEESVSTFVYNKTLMKHIYNNTLLLENTSRKFTTTFDVAGISQYVGFKYLNITELSSIQYTTTLNNYIGVNEVVTTHTVNRCLEEVYNIQLKLVNNMQEKSTNVYPLVSTPVLLTARVNTLPLPLPQPELQMQQASTVPQVQAPSELPEQAPVAPQAPTYN